uniref:Ig-like domain-containing protein n=1 Tax=Plectus sambesii TaxID=2011161 RepID=A0A914V4A2_9BILA
MARSCNSATGGVMHRWNGVGRGLKGEPTCLSPLCPHFPPRITEKPRRVVVQNGEMAELWCEALGVPEPHITWLKDDVAIAETSVESFTDKRVTTAAFKKVEPSQAGVYTCKAENWAGTSYKDVDLVVLIPPSILPERMNITAKLRETVIIPCNATGIPEPVVSWYKEPNIDIVGNGEKFQILGTSLAIRDVREDDDSFYRCVAKSKAGVAIGFRKLDVDVPKKDWKVIWVECDENGNPVRTTYVPARGDLPDDDNTLLPWRTEFQELPENGTNGVLIRCLPGPRGPRRAPIQKAPHFVELPKTSMVALGATLEITCGAVGPPTPTIAWMLNGKLLENAPASHNGKSVLKIEALQEKDVGTYTCIARNDIGSTSATAVVRLALEGASANLLSPMSKSVWTRRVAVLTCIDKGVPVPAKLGYLAHWTKNGRPIVSDDQIHVLLNGSLVVFEPEALDPVELEKYHCSLKSRQHLVSYSTQMVTEVVPQVVVTPKRTVVKPGSSVFIHCSVTAEPLTTKIEWTRNDVAVVLDSRTFMHVNNTLLQVLLGRKARTRIDELPYGGWVAPDIYYMGYAGVLRFAGLRIAGLSGIYKFHDYNKGHFEFPPLNENAKRSAYHVRSTEVFRLKQLKQDGQPSVDIVVSHDWPRGITDYGDVDTLLRVKPFFREEIDKGQLGNPSTMSLLQELRPRYWFAAHMHVKFPAIVPHAGGLETRYLALDKPIPRRQFLQIIEVEVDADADRKLSYDSQWLAILRSTDSLTCLLDRTVYMPGPGGPDGERWNFRPSEDEVADVIRRFNDDLVVPDNFRRTAPPHRPTDTKRNTPTSLYYRNPQTTEFCEKLGNTDVNREFCERNTAGVGQPFYLVEGKSEIINPDEIDLDETEGADESTTPVASTEMTVDAGEPIDPFVAPSLKRTSEEPTGAESSTTTAQEEEAQPPKMKRRNAAMYESVEPAVDADDDF